MLIARLIADTDGLETRLQQAVDELAANGMKDISRMGSRRIESGKSILQIQLGDGDRANVREIVERCFSPWAAIVTDRDITIPKLFVSDMDSTIIGQECIDELADFAGLKDKVSAITERAMQGELDFESALRDRVALLKGLDEAAIDRCLEERIMLTDGASALVRTLKVKGCRTVLVTGGFHHFADVVADRAGFDHVVGNRLDISDGGLTGELVGPIVDSSTKLSVLEEGRERIGERTVLATGDGANDIPMLEAADFGIAFEAKPKAKAAADGWVDQGGLFSILHLLDIPQHQWLF